ncbi:MAG: hypothetical protein NE330_00780 [Lentisphaeraceae bacterium]|nr:hypothetical protein [Lentisphaeraceae bacterium]
MKERLYELTPLIYREKDFKEKQPLRALMGTLQKAHDVLQDDIYEMYNDWFIETCREKIIPHIGDLVGIKDLFEENLLKSERRYVANYFAYKRRQGSHNTLSNALMDSSGYNFFAVSEYENMALTWTPRDTDLKAQTFSSEGLAGELANSPFATANRTPDFKTPTTGLLRSPNGKINRKSVTLYAWRLETLPVIKSDLKPLAGKEGCYHLNPFGMDIQLSNQPENLSSLYKPITYKDYPLKITRENYEAFCKNSPKDTLDFWQDSPIHVYEFDPDSKNYSHIDSQYIEVSDLSSWQKINSENTKLVIDPETGRVLILDKSLYGKVFIDYSYISSTLFGAGPHVSKFQTNERDRILVSKSGLLGETEVSLEAALVKWQQSTSHIYFVDNHIYQLNKNLEINLDGKDLFISSGNNCQPLIEGDLCFKNHSSKTVTVKVQGFNILGTVRLDGNISFELCGSTLMSSEGDALVSSQNKLYYKSISISKSLIKGFDVPEDTFMEVEDSVLVSQGEMSHMNSVSLLRVTVLGNFSCNQAPLIQDTIVSGSLTVKNAAKTRIVYSYVGELKVGRGAMLEKLINGVDSPFKILHFKSSDIASGEFAMLSEFTEEKILSGASNGEEIGVFNSFRLRLRDNKILERIKQYLPYELEADLVYIN